MTAQHWLKKAKDAEKKAEKLRYNANGGNNFGYAWAPYTPTGIELKNKAGWYRAYARWLGSR